MPGKVGAPYGNQNARKHGRRKSAKGAITPGHSAKSNKSVFSGITVNYSHPKVMAAFARHKKRGY